METLRSINGSYSSLIHDLVTQSSCHSIHIRLSVKNPLVGSFLLLAKYKVPLMKPNRLCLRLRVERAKQAKPFGTDFEMMGSSYQMIY